MAVFEVIQHRFWKAEFWDPVAENAADPVLSLKDGYIVAIPGQDHRDGQTGGAGANDSCPHAVGGSGALGHLIGVGGRNIIFNRRKVHRSALAPQYTVAFALILVIADQAAHRGQGIIFKKHPPRLVQMTFF